MGNDMSWEQKCRISALRAACASQFTLHGVPAHLTMPSDVESDEAMTRRILVRAETFRIALMGDGALDYVPDDDEASEVPALSGTCRSCMRAIGMHDDGTWIDVSGSRYCGQAQTLMHRPGESTPTTLGEAFRTPISTHCPGCGSSRKDTPLMIGQGEEWKGCEHKWHQL